MVGRTIGTCHSAAIEAEHHVQVLQGHIVHDLVIGPLHEGAVDVAEGDHPLGGHARGKGDRVLLCDAHVKSALGHRFHHQLQGATGRHGGGDTHDAFVLLGEFDDGVPEDVLVLRWFRGLGRDLDDLAGVLVEQARCVPLGGAAGLGGGVPLALGRDQVQQFRARNVLEVPQHMLHLLDIVPVDGPEVAEVERFEEIGLLEKRPLDHVAHFGGDGLSVRTKFGHLAQQLPHLILDAVVGVGRGDVGEVIFQGPDVGVDRHAIVVEDHNHVVVLPTAVVQPFERQARRHGPIANHRNVLALVAFDLVGHRHAQSSTDARGTVSDAKGVERALTPFGKAAESLVDALGVKRLSAFRQDFVTVGLVPHIPDNLIFRGVEDVMQGDGQLDHAQAGAKMPALFADHIHNELAQLFAHLRQVLHPEFPTKVGGLVDLRQEGASGIKDLGHGAGPMIAGVGEEQT